MGRDAGSNPAGSTIMDKTYFDNLLFRDIWKALGNDRRRNMKADVMALTGVSDATFHDWVKGRRNPPLAKRKLVAAYLGELGIKVDDPEKLFPRPSTR